MNRPLYFLTTNDYEIIKCKYRKLTEKNCRALCFIYLGLYAGLSVKNILDLKKLDIDFKYNIIRSPGYCITMNPVLKDKLLTYSLCYKQDTDNFFHKLNSNEMISYDNIQQVFVSLRKVNNLKINMQILNNTFYKNLILNNLNKDEIFRTMNIENLHKFYNLYKNIQNTKSINIFYFEV